MAGLKVLIANATLATLTGTETYVRDLALGLLRKGHTPVVYAPELGPIAEELRRSIRSSSTIQPCPPVRLE